MKYFLAPMGGVSKLPFRRLCLHLGADLVWSEQINAGLLLKSSLSFNKAKNIHTFYNQDNLILEVHEEEKSNIVIQIASNQSTEASEAVNKIKHLCYGIDLNMDPPVPDPKGTGIGKNLLINPPLGAQIIKRIHSDHPGVKIFVKMRMLNSPSDTIEFINLLQSSGAQYVILHMRKLEATLQEPLSELDQVKEITKQLTIPFGLCGGFFSKISVLEIGNESIMIGRGAAHYPGVFSLLKNKELLQEEENKFNELEIKEKVKELNQQHSSLRPLLVEEQLFYKTLYPCGLNILPQLIKLKQYMEETDMSIKEKKFLFSYILKSHSELAHLYFAFQAQDFDKIELTQMK